MKKNLLLLLIIILSVKYFYQYNKFMSINGNDWEKISNYIKSEGKIGQDIVYCPGSLKPFSTASGGDFLFDFNRLTKPDPKKTNYNSYFEIGFCKKSNSTIIKTHNNIDFYITKIDYKSETKKNISSLYKNATVSIIKKGSRQECPLVSENDNEHFSCGSEEWQKIRLKFDFINNQKKLCLFAHPIKDSLVEINLNDLPEGSILLGFLDFGANQQKNDNPIDINIDNTNYKLTKQNREETISTKGEKSTKIQISAENIDAKHACISFYSK